MSTTEESNTAKAWVLREGLESKKRGRPVYFKHWTGIGPACTEELGEAERFSSRLAACQSRAYVHSLSCFEPVEVGNDD